MQSFLDLSFSVTFGCNKDCAERLTKGRNAHPLCEIWSCKQAGLVCLFVLFFPTKIWIYEYVWQWHVHICLLYVFVQGLCCTLKSQRMYNPKHYAFSCNQCYPASSLWRQILHNECVWLARAFLTFVCLLHGLHCSHFPKVTEDAYFCLILLTVSKSGSDCLIHCSGSIYV